MKAWNPDLPVVQFRVARPTNQPAKVKEFYTEGIGLREIGSFNNHEGYSGVMLGLPDHH